MPNDDYIKRSDAVELLNRYARTVDNTDTLGGVLRLIVRDIPAADVEPKQRWIPVTDTERLPEIHRHVLVYSKFKGIQVDYRSKDGHWYTTAAVTHWSELPEPPKEDEETK